MKPVLAVSMGDPAGIGPEVLVAAAAAARVRRACSLTVYGDPGVLEAARKAMRLRLADLPAIEHVEPVTESRTAVLRRPGKRAGHAAFLYLDAAAHAVMAGQYDGLVTAPISKYWMSRAGHEYDGHTEYLSELTGRSATMMLAGRRLRVVLATTHLAISEVPKALSSVRISRAGRATDRHLREFHAIRRPRIAVAALNPHGGEGGLFGDEERRLILPATRAMRRAGIDARGPFPADTLFAAAAAGDYDAVLCMYHDQALIPLKLLEFGRAVNVSMGLPFVRTSPDHGTAYELAGSGRASAEGMIAAILAAASMVRSSRRREA